MKQSGIVLVIALIMAIGAGGLLFYELGQKKEKPVEVAKQEPQGPTIESQFEVVLNDFLRSVNEQVLDYRTQRKVIVELVKPENLRDPAYVEENYKMVQELVPTLNQKMDGIMGVFEETESKIEALLEGQPGDAQKTILAKWQEVKDEQSQLYVAFFAIEGSILDAYESLMSFYFSKSGQYTVDPAGGRIVFENFEDEAQERSLRQTIASLSSQQREVLQSQ